MIDVSGLYVAPGISDMHVHVFNGTDVDAYIANALTSLPPDGDKQKLIDVVLNGLNEPITVKEKPYNSIMPQHSFLRDEDIAQVEIHKTAIQ